MLGDPQNVINTVALNSCQINGVIAGVEESRSIVDVLTHTVTI